MKQWIFTPLVALTMWWGIGDNIAQAQTWQLGQYSPPQVRQHSTVSPYLNLGQPGTNPAVDYYGIVQPQMNASRSLGQLQQGLLNLQTDPNNPALLASGSAPLSGSQTGHPATYMNYQRFFPLSYGTTSGALGAGITGTGYPGTGYPGTGTTGAPAFRPFYSNAFNSIQR